MLYIFNVSFYKWGMKRVVHPILFALVVAFAVVQGIFITRGQMFWDEAVYVGMGKYLWSLGQSGIYESFRPIVLPLILGFFWKLGLDPVMIGRAFMIVMSSWSLYLVYLIAKKHMNHWFSLLSVIAVALTPVYFLFSTKLMTSMLALFFLLAALYRLQINRASHAGIFLALAFLTRFPAGLFLIPVFFMAGKEKWTVLKMFVLTTIPYFILNLVMGNGLIRPLLEAGAHQANSIFAGPWAFYLCIAFMVPLLFCFIPGILTAAGQKRYGLLALAVLPLLYFSFIPIKQERFLILFLPFVVIVSMHALYGLFRFLRPVNILTKVLFAFLVFSFAVSVTHIELPGQMYYPSYTQYFNDFDDKVVITTTPLPAAFSDAKFIPAYFDINQAFYTYRLNKDDADYMVYSHSAFYCEHFGDDCQLTQDFLDESLSVYPNVFERVDQNATFSIYQLSN